MMNYFQNRVLLMTRKVMLYLFIIAFSLPLNAQVRSYLKEANKRYELHAFNLAISSYQRVLARRPDNVEALGKLADCYRNLNQMEQAEKWYAKAVEQRKVKPEYILNYAKVLKALGKYDEARRWFLLYAQSDPVTGNHFAQSCSFALGQLNAPSAYIVSPEGSVNTSSSDFGPTFYGEEKVVFASARKDIQRSSANWANRSRNQLFVANINAQSRTLTSTLFLKRSSEEAYNEGPLTYAPDLSEVMYTQNDFVDGTRHISSSGMNLNIFSSTINRNGDWVNKVPFPYNGSDYSTGFPNYSPDGDALYFASDRPDGFGGYDIYVSFRTGNGWSTPENLGPVINSPGDEISPFFDGQTLFFSSDYHQGMGGHDVFRAEQTNGRWIRIVHLGSKVNSPRDDYGFIYNSFQNVGYLTSNRAGGKGAEDIYKVAKSGDGVVIRVKNASDGSPIVGAQIDFSACRMGTHNTDANGIYSFQATQGIDCNVTISKDDYIASNLNISVFGTQRNRSFEVTLSKEGEAYIGRIIGYYDSQPISDIKVIANNQQTGSFSETVTNNLGEYSMALSPNATYILRYSSPGYRDINRTIRTTDGMDKSLLGVISMLPSTSSEPDPNSNVDKGPSTTSIQSGYAVQIAAISKPELDRFANLESLGQLYYRNESSLYKVRLGVFNSRSEAEEKLRLVKGSGFSGAFIIEERGGTVKTPDAPTSEDGSEPVNTVEGDYKIQLGAFRSTSRFDASRISHLGNIEDKKSRNLTIKLLASFSDEGTAKDILREVKRAGFPDAFVVLDEDGRLKKIR